MNREKMKELMIDYLDGKLEGELKEFVEKQINKNEEISQEFNALKEGNSLLDQDLQLEPDSTLKLDFERMLQGEIDKESQRDLGVERVRVIDFNLFSKIAAGLIILAMGSFIGWWVSNQNTDDDLMTMRRELEVTRTMVLTYLQDESSASNRLKGVNTAFSSEGKDTEITTKLIHVMNNDNNSNVRLAAARALARFTDDPLAKKALIDALSTQTDPVVQIELINIMIELKEQESIDKLKEIIQDDQSIEAVKDEAHMAIFKLS